MRKLIIYGDIHGCIDEFKELRAKVNPQGDDEEICVGDLVDRGPNSLEVLRFARENGIKSILGNHEKKYLKYKAYKESPKKKQQAPQLDEEQKKLFGSLSKEDFTYLQSMPHFIKRSDITLIHAGLSNGIKLLDETSEKELDKTNWIRFLNADQNPISMGQETKQDKFWTQYYDGTQGYIVYGHSVFDDVREEKFSLGIDTGCVYGNKLTAAIFEDTNNPSKKEIIQVNAREKLSYAQMVLARPFIFDKKKVDTVLDNKKMQIKKIDVNYTEDLLAYAPYILQSPSNANRFPCILEEPTEANHFEGIVCGDQHLEIKEKYIVCVDSDIAFLVIVFKKLVDIPFEQYVKLHHNMTTMTKKNKSSLIVFEKKNKFPLVEISHLITNEQYSKEKLGSFSTNSCKLIVCNDGTRLLYKMSGYKIDREDIKQISIKFQLDEEVLYRELTSKLNQIIKTYTRVPDYIKSLTQSIEKTNGFSFNRTNLLSYHLLDNEDKKIPESFLEGLLQYRRAYKDNYDELFDSIGKIRITKDIQTYGNENVILHVGNKTFINDKLTDNYLKGHYFIYLIALVQSMMVNKLISNALFQKFDKEDRKKMESIKEESLNFLSHINFEKISHNSIRNRYYKFYRKCLDTNSMKNELLTIVEKVGSELENKHKAKLELWLTILTVITGLGGLLGLPTDIEASYPIISELIGKYYKFVPLTLGAISIFGVIFFIKNKFKWTKGQ